MLPKTGKLVLRYIGPNGRHTELYKDGVLIKAGFNCNKSIMLLLWCACNSKYKLIDEMLDSDFEYREYELGSWLCKVIFRTQLFSKYDIMMRFNAVAHAYRDFHKKKLHDPVRECLSAKQDLISFIKTKYGINELEVVYELNENEIYESGGVQPRNPGHRA